MGVGQALAVTTVYLVEITPTETRGAWAGLLEFYVVFGVMVGYFIVFASRNLPNSLSWRIPFIVQAGNAMVLAAGLLFVPFSPRWLVQKSRVADAETVLINLRKGVAARELIGIQSSLAQRTEQPEGTFLEMFSPRYRRRTLLGIFIMVGLQVNGVSLDALTVIKPLGYC